MKVSRFIVVMVLMAALSAAVFATAGSESTGASEEMVITVLPFTARGSTLDENTAVELYLEERYDVQLEPWYDLDFYDTEARNVRLASGDIPDMLSTFDPSWIDIGAVRELPQEMIREHMPKYMAQADAYLGDQVWRRTEFDGVNYAVPTALSMASTGLIMGFRADWMEAVGMPAEELPGLPFMKGPDTLEEITELLTRFHTMDPDGDGIDDTYGWFKWTTNHNFNQTVFPTVFGSFGIRLRTWDVSTGTATYSMVDARYKEALHYLRGWWDLGIIHPDAPTGLREDSLRTMGNDEWGAFEDFDAWMQQTANGPWGVYFENNPGAQIAISVTPSRDGNRGTWFRDPNWGPWSIGAHADDAKATKIMEMMEDIYSDFDTYADVFYGPGTWAKDENGYANPIDPEWNNEMQQSYGGRLFTYPPHIVPPVDKVYIQPRRYAFQAYIEATQTAGPSFGVRPAWNEDERPLEAAINAISDEYGWRAVSGQIDIDATWDDYVNEMMNSGLRQLLAAANEQF